MSIATEYLLALYKVVGEDKLHLARYQLAMARDVLTDDMRLKLERAETNTERRRLMDDWFGYFLADPLKNFVALLASNGHIAVLDGIDDTGKGRRAILVTSAQTLQGDLKDDIVAKLSLQFQGSSIVFRKDANLIGGIRIRVDDREYDYSLKARLNALLKH